MIGRLARTGRRTLALLRIGRRDVVILLTLGVAVAGLEGIGVGLLIPVLRYIEQGRAAVDPRVLAVVERLPVPLLAGLLLVAFVPVLARQIARYFHQVHSETARLHAIAELRTTGFDAMLAGELPFFAAERQGRLVSALTSQIEFSSSALTYLLWLIEAAILLAVYTTVLALLAPWLMPLAAVAIIVVLILVRGWVRQSSAYGRRVSDAFQALHVLVAEKLAGIRLVKIRAQEAEEARHHARVVHDLTATIVQQARRTQLIEVSIEPMMIVGAFVALYLAVAWFGMTLAGLGVVMFALLRMVPYLKQITSAAQELSALTASLEEVHAVIEKARSHQVSSGPVVFGSLAREIRFDRVGFRYPDSTEQWAIRDVSFTLERGTLTAIVGQSGAGKSTVLDLIARLREPTEGVITFDGVPVSELERRSVRSAVGMVDQHGFLFNDTVANNITYGVAGASRAEVCAAVRRAHADGFVAQLPQGLDTMVGDRGVRLSGGQRQRLSLARVILQDPDVLLLDEPTSALDAESEEVIQEALADLARTKVVVVVAHRLSTIRRASQILVLEDGRIVERGHHEALMKDPGAYRRLFELQIQA